MTANEIQQWNRQVNDVLARKRNGLRICDLMGEDLDDIERLRNIGTPIDVVEELLGD